MGKWFNGWRRWLAGRETPPASPLPLPVAPDWRPQHKDALVSFFKSEAGTVLVQRMAAVAAHNARAASQDAMHASHSAGRAAGFYDALEWLASQSRIEFETRISGAAADQAATSAQPSEGEAALRELLSP
jgi:hypothetical protein